MEAALVTCERRGLSPHRMGWFRSAQADGLDRGYVRLARRVRRQMFEVIDNEVFEVIDNV